MSQTHACPDKALLVTYMYGEGDPPEREAFEAHLEACQACRDELGALERVRVDLSWWESPEPVGRVRIVPPETPAPGFWGWVATPAFGLAAAALLLLAVSAAVAGVEIRYDAGGLTVRTGWGERDAGAPEAVGGGRTPLAATAAGSAESAPRALESSDGSAPWRADLDALAGQIRARLDELGQSRPAVVQPAAGAAQPLTLTPEVRGFVEQVLAESEQRQRQDLALRLAELSRDLELQRRTDLVRIQQVFGRLEGRTEAEAARSREMMNYFVRASQQTPQR
jgi:hypothetical protein